MDLSNKLYLSLGLLFSVFVTGTVQSSTDEEQTRINSTIMEFTNTAEQSSMQLKNDIQVEEPEHELSTEEQIDQELYEVFGIFFDEHDTTPFSKIITQVINLLKRKRSTLQAAQLIKCDEIIKILEKNKTNYSFPVWARILINPDLLHLMSEDTRSYIHGISNNVKIRALIYRLHNH